MRQKNYFVFKRSCPIIRGIVEFRDRPRYSVINGHICYGITLKWCCKKVFYVRNNLDEKDVVFDRSTMDYEELKSLGMDLGSDLWTGILMSPIFLKIIFCENIFGLYI